MTKQAKTKQQTLSDMYREGLNTIQKANKKLLKAIKDGATETAQEIEPAARRKAQIVLKKGADLFDKLSKIAAPKTDT